MAPRGAAGDLDNCNTVVGDNCITVVSAKFESPNELSITYQIRSKIGPPTTVLQLSPPSTGFPQATSTVVENRPAVVARNSHGPIKRFSHTPVFPRFPPTRTGARARGTPKSLFCLKGWILCFATLETKSTGALQLSPSATTNPPGALAPSVSLHGRALRAGREQSRAKNEAPARPLAGSKIRPEKKPGASTGTASPPGNIRRPSRQAGPTPAPSRLPDRAQATRKRIKTAAPGGTLGRHGIRRPERHEGSQNRARKEGASGRARTTPAAPRKRRPKRPARNDSGIVGTATRNDRSTTERNEHRRTPRSGPGTLRRPGRWTPRPRRSGAETSTVHQPLQSRTPWTPTDSTPPGLRPGAAEQPQTNGTTGRIRMPRAGACVSRNLPRPPWPSAQKRTTNARTEHWNTRRQRIHLGDSTTDDRPLPTPSSGRRFRSPLAVSMRSHRLRVMAPEMVLPSMRQMDTRDHDHATRG